MSKIEINNFDDCKTVLIYRKQPWIDWVHALSPITFNIKLELNPSVFILKTNEEDLEIALKPYWKSIFEQQLPFPGNRPELTEENFYEWFEIKSSEASLLASGVSTIGH